MKEKIVEILRIVTDDANIENESGLIDNEILNSLELMELITELEDTFGISIEMEEIKAENFNDIDAICRLVEKLGA
ncbi:MAG: acyl carrier protein [Lachnospiraceae bacterium]|nr:acyl carrier protein [Lachnospiraceae bacterium]